MLSNGSQVVQASIEYIKRSNKSTHFISLGVFLTLSILSSFSFLSGNTLFVYRDLEWPSNPDGLLLNAIYALDLDSMRRVLFLGPFFTITDLLGLSSLAAEKIFFVAIFAAIAFSAYYASFKFLSSKTKSSKRSIFLISILAGFFYLYNPYVVQKVILTGYGFAFSYAMIPLIFYFFDKALNEKSFKNTFLASIFVSLALAGTSQFFVYLPLYLLVPWFGITIAHRYARRERIIPTIKNFSYIIGISVVISLYWILPAFFVSTERPPSPSYILTDLMLDSFSSQTTLLNGFRLLGVWWPYIELTPIVDQSFWTLLTFAIPITVFTSFLLAKRTELKFYSLAFLILALMVLFFFTGVQQPFPEFYPNLYNIPVVGWMFRVPDANAMFLPFYFMMIIVLMGHSLSGQLRKGLVRFLKFVPPAILIFSISLISWPMFTGDYGGIYKDNNPFVERPLSAVPDNIIQIPESNAVIVGGSNIATSVNSLGLPTIFSGDRSVMYADRNLGNLEAIKDFNGIVVTDERNDLFLHFMGDETSLVKPFDATLTHDTTGSRWSRASTSNPLHGSFTSYVNSQGLTSNDFDYGMGLVFTWGKDTLSIPFNIKEDGSYELFIRHMQNPKGGSMDLSLDGKLIEINTREPSTKFVWKSLGNHFLSKGSHLLELENKNGFNVVNVFSFIPTSKTSELTNRMADYMESFRISFILEGESSFFSSDNIDLDGDRVRLNPESQLQTEINLPKDSTYTIAARMETCERCSMDVLINAGNNHRQLSLYDDKKEFKWVYFTLPLSAGPTTFGLRTNGDTSLDKVVIYSDSHIGERVADVFSVPTYQPVTHSVEQLDPTHYKIETTVDEHWVLKFDRSYNPMWKATVNGKEFSAVPLDNNRNGFYITETGNLSVIIEYGTQKWFIVGMTITVIAITASVGYLIAQHVRNGVRKAIVR